MYSDSFTSMKKNILEELKLEVTSCPLGSWLQMLAVQFSGMAEGIKDQRYTQPDETWHPWG